MRTPGLGLLLGFAMMGVIVGSGAVHAEKRRVVLMDIDGARTDALQKEVAKLIKSAHFVVPETAYRRVADKRGATKLNPANIRKVCKDLGCDAIVDGVIEAEDGGYVFVVRVREAATGRIKSGLRCG